MERRLTAKAQKPVTPAQRAAKKKLLAITLQRARAIKIEGEDLLDDPDLADELDAQSLAILPAEVVFNVAFAKRKPEQIEVLCDWQLVTADLAKQLDLMFTEREDFGMNIMVKAHGVSLVVREADVEEVIA